MGNWSSKKNEEKQEEIKKEEYEVKNEQKIVEEKKEQQQKKEEKEEKEAKKEENEGLKNEEEKEEIAEEKMEEEKEEKEGENEENNIQENNNDSISLNFDCLGNIITDSLMGFMDMYDFYIFKSINNLWYLIYTDENKSISIYDMKNEQKISEIKNPNALFYPKYFYDKINNRDIIIAISSIYAKDKTPEYKNMIKLYDFRNLECFLELKDICEDDKELYPACILYDNNQNDIITLYGKDEKTECIRVFDFNGNIKKEIQTDEEDTRTFYIETFYDENLSKNFIITLNNGYVKSYDYNQNELYHKYDDNVREIHYGCVIQKKDEMINLIDSAADGVIRIWDFHSGDLLKKTKIESRIFSICLWDSNLLCIGCHDKKIRILDLNTGKIVKILSAHIIAVFYVRKIILPLYGECLISKDAVGRVKMWESDY